MRRVIGAGPRSAQGTGSTGWASFTCAGSARAGNGGRCPLRAGPSGRLATVHSHRRPVPHHATARSRTRRSRWRRRRREHQMTDRPIILSRPWRSASSARRTRGRGNGRTLRWDALQSGQAPSGISAISASSTRPQRSHHRRPPRKHPGTLMMDALPAARNQTSGQQRRAPRRRDHRSNQTMAHIWTFGNPGVHRLPDLRRIPNRR
jgi:hypothetical protein